MDLTWWVLDGIEVRRGDGPDLWGAQNLPKETGRNNSEGTVERG